MKARGAMAILVTPVFAAAAFSLVSVAIDMAHLEPGLFAGTFEIPQRAIAATLYAYAVGIPPQILLLWAVSLSASTPRLPAVLFLGAGAAALPVFILAAGLAFGVEYAETTPAEVFAEFVLPVLVAALCGAFSAFGFWLVALAGPFRKHRRPQSSEAAV